MRVRVQSTKASVENLSLIQRGKGEVAFVLGDSVKLGWEGSKQAGFPDKLRGIAAIYPNYIQIVASQQSGVKTLADLYAPRAGA